MQDLENACDAPLTALIKVQYSAINSPYPFYDKSSLAHYESPGLDHPRKDVLTGDGILPRGDEMMNDEFQK